MKLKGLAVSIQQNPLYNLALTILEGSITEGAAKRKASSTKFGKKVNIGHLFEIVGLVSQAIDINRETAFLYSDLNLRCARSKRVGGEVWAAINFQHAEVLVPRGEYRRALRHLDVAKSYFERQNMLGKLANCYLNTGIVHASILEYHQALELFDKALKMSIQAGDELILADCHFNLAVLHGKFGERDQLREHGLKAKRLYEKFGDMVRLAKCMMYMPGVDSTTDDPDAVTSDLTLAIQLLQERSHYPLVARCYFILFRLMLFRDEDEKAWFFLKKGTHFLAEGGEESTEIMAHALAAAATATAAYGEPQLAQAVVDWIQNVSPILPIWTRTGP